jgi:[ribosomal protein S5]-alanine N-acetyltransferase
MFAENLNIPNLKTDRLLLRPYDISDVPRLIELLKDKEISDTSPTIPYPYGEREAVEWIVGQFIYTNSGRFLTYAVVSKKTDELIGSISLTINPEEKNAEIGFWMGKAFWKKGYCTEAAKSIMDYVFETRDINKIYGECMSDNQASSGVLKNLGMTFNTKVEKHIMRINQTLTLDQYVITKEL